jgi:hypothetical protein
MYTSTSGSGSLALFLLSCTSSLYWDTTFCIASPSMPMYSMKVRAVVLLGEYVRMITEHSTRSVSLLRSDDIERRARRVKRVSNWATARSRSTKLPRMSTVVGSARWYRYLHEATSVAIRWLGHILRTGHDVVQLVQGHLEVKGMLRGGVGLHTSNRLLLDVLAFGLLARSDDAFHAVRHDGCSWCICGEEGRCGCGEG